MYPQNKIQKEIALKKIEEICAKKNYIFNGFCDKQGNNIDWGYGVAKTYLKLKCNKCGNTWNTTSYRCFVKGQGCKTCNTRSIKLRKNINDVLNSIYKQCQEKKYTFLGFCNKEGLEQDYKNARTYLKLKCNICDNIWTSTTYDNFMKGNGCPQCGKHKILTKEEAITKIIQKTKGEHLSFIRFCNKDGVEIDWGHGICKTYVDLECQRCGYRWNTTNFDRYVHNDTYICPKCYASFLEKEIELVLSNNQLNYQRQYRDEFLGKQSLDFYIPSKKIAIECQGIQHFKSVDHFGGEEEFKKRIKRDKQKAALCEQKGIKLLYYSNLGIEYPYHVYEDKDELLKEILKE